MPLDVLIEALLFCKATPQTKSKLIRLFDVSEADFTSALEILKERLHNSAIRLIETDVEIQLATAPELSPFIDSLRKQEISGDIGKAGAETLAVILYRGPVTRAEIDRIRGVNSSFILRNLLTRGLIARERSPKGEGYQFYVTAQLLQLLGVTDRHLLPRFSEFMNIIDNFESNQQHEQNH